ncbi:hypothetical protein BGZ74_000573 [Mortierella antarctica]|nr:hypothetical protein BGZ74_000573 [Mortierella antarctica]
MLSNKTFSLFAIAAITLVLLANVEAAPAKASLEDRIACKICDKPPECNLRCPGGYCDINYCTCLAMCKKGNIP